MSTDKVIEVFEEVFETFGTADRIRSDNGPQFRKPFSRWCSENGIIHETSSPENPQSNGHAERGVRIAKNLLKKSANMSDYRKNMAIYRNTPTGDGIGSPSELMFNRKWKSHLPELPKYSSSNKY